MPPRCFSHRAGASLAGTLGAWVALIASGGCERRAAPTSAPAPPPPPTAARPSPDAGAPADRVVVRRVVTLYRWSRTEPGGPATEGQSVEHGAVRLHLVFELHRDPAQRAWVTVGALAGSTAVPESARMRPAGTSHVWHVPPRGHTEYTLEQFGGEVRPGEPITAAVAGAWSARQAVAVGAEPSMVRLPAAGTFPPSPLVARGQLDAVVVLVIPVANRRGGRYLVYALDLLPEVGGFAANGVMSHAPSAAELERYVRWMRDPNGMARDRNPPVAMAPIDRT